MPRDPRKTWQYCAHAVIQEENPARLTSLMQELYRRLDDNEDEQGISTPFGYAKIPEDQS